MSTTFLDHLSDEQLVAYAASATASKRSSRATKIPPAARRMVADADEIDDLTHEALLRLIRSLPG